MRVHEFAKEFSSSSKEVLELLKEQGFSVKSHMSILQEEELEWLTQHFKDKESKILKSDAETPASGSTSLKEKESKNMQLQKNQEVKNIQPQSALKEEALIDLPQQEIALNQEKVFFQLEPKSMAVEEFAQKVKIPVNEVIITLLKQGKMFSKNSIMPEEVVLSLARHYEISVAKKVSAKDKNSSLSEALQARAIKKSGQTREPVVVVMGHVDHGKTTLLDYIRKTRVAAKEKGGITQHLGAYQVKTQHGNMVFLDTPGHEAFAKIRKRGISVADVVVLVIAADDGIMPQTVECIKIAKAIDASIVVAINKVDKADAAKIEIVKRQLAQYDLLPEEWGGDVICVPLSAKEGTGVDQLLEMIILVSEMLELKAEQGAVAEGYILEARMQKGRGALATVLCRQGTLRLGDYFKTGGRVGRVASMTDFHGSSINLALPSVPVLVAGFEELPTAGSLFEVITEAEYRKLRFVKEEASVFNASRSVQHGSNEHDKQKFNLILKADTYSSLEAILDAFEKIDLTKCKQLVVIRSGIGEIRESDVLLAQDTESVIVGFHTKVENSAQIIARQSGVKLYMFDIIYKLLEELEKIAARAKEVKMVKTKIGEAEVLKTFDIKNIGIIAGCIVRDGRLSGKGVMTIYRGRKEVATGKIVSLQRDKKSVKEVHTGFECAFLVEGFNDWQVGDIAHCFIEMPS